MLKEQIHSVEWCEPLALPVLPRTELQDGDWFIYTSYDSFRRLMQVGDAWITYNKAGRRASSASTLPTLMRECGYAERLRILSPCTREDYESLLRRRTTDT